EVCAESGSLIRGPRPGASGALIPGVMLTSSPTDRPRVYYRRIVGDRWSVSLVRWRVPVKPLRVRQAEATRSLLIEVARESFTEHGYATTSIDDIIRQAGVARGA